MYTTKRHILSYIKGILSLAITFLYLGTQQVHAEITIDDLINPDEPYPISTAEEFAEAFDVYNNEHTLKIFCITISNDIDMNDLSNDWIFSPITYAQPIQIVCEGNGHTIKNLTFESEGIYTGLFPILAKGSRITDITFENIDATLNGRSYSGALTSYVSGDAIISNCSIFGKVSYLPSTNSVTLGGVIGTIGPNAKGSSTINNIITDLKYEISGAVSVFGGVIGSCNSSGIEYSNIINKSQETLNVSSTNGAGGVIGYIFKSQSLNIHDCENYTNIDASSANVGGIIGNFASEEGGGFSQLYNCSNAGNIHSALGNVGGIVGKSYLLNIHDCVNIGNISSYEPSVGNQGDIAGVGGIVGLFKAKEIIAPNTIVYSCVNMGAVSSTLPGNTAGIIGYYTSESTSYNQTGTTASAKIFPFKNCLSITNDASNRIVGEFLFNTTPEHNCVGGLYADSSLGVGPATDSVHYLNNSSLITGKTPFYYFSSNIGYYLDNEEAQAKKFEPALLQKTGYYPHVVAENDIAKLASLPIIISDNERLDSIASGFSCTIDHGVTWSSAKGLFKISEDGNASILGAGPDTIIGRIGNAVIKRYIYLYKNVFGGGNGTFDSPYILKNIAHLEELRDSLQTPGWSREKHFRVDANISGLDFSLSSTRNTAFTGEFDGNGFSIRMNINNPNGDAALFGFVESAYIHDLQTSGSVTGKSKVAGICATAYNCIINYCYNSAKISGATAGGIVAYSEGGEFMGLCNAGTITGTENAGGVIGHASDIDADTRISDCVNSGYIKGAYAGGIIGNAEKITANCQFHRFINYGSVFGSSVAYPYAYTNQSGFIYQNSFFDIQITKNGNCQTQDFMRDGASIGLDIELTELDDVAYERYSDDANAAFIPVFVKKMKNSELLGILPSFENDELTSNVQTSPKLLQSGILSLRKIEDNTEHTKLTDLLTNKDVQAILVQKSESGDERETLINITGTPFTSGDGSEEDPYLIESISDLQNLADLIEKNKVTDDYYVKAKTNNWSYNKHFKLTKDILGDGTASSVVTSTIASAEKPFQGIFDGANHTIEISINNQNQNYQALFASIESGAEIKNLIVTGIVKGKMNVAGVVAHAASTKSGTNPVISNVVNNAHVTGSADNIGGICGKSDAYIKNCVNAGKIYISEGSNPYHTGGVVGTSSNDVLECMNIGNVNGHRRVGGICGSVSHELRKGLVKNCINAGMVYSSCPASAEFACLGGIVGSAHNFGIESSLNLNRVESINGNSVDAIVGSVTGDLVSEKAVVNCFYDKQISVLPSKNGTGLLTSEMNELDIEGFNYKDGFYPSMSSPISAEKISLLTSSTLKLFVSDDKSAYDEISKLMNIGDVKLPSKDIKWKSKTGVVKVEEQSNGYEIRPIEVGKDTLTISNGTFSKEIAVDVYCIPVRVDTTISSCQTVSVRKSDGTEVVCNNDTIFTEVYTRENSNCDSTIRYTVKIKKLKEYKIDTVLCGVNSAIGAKYRGFNYTNTETITIKDTVDCDSAITTRLRVVIPKTDSVYSQSGCDSVYCEVNGKFYYESTDFSDTIRAKGCGCDSIIIKVKLDVSKSVKSQKNQVFLDSYELSGKTLKGGDEAILLDTFTAKNGCDSIVEKHIYVYDRVYKMDTTIYACDFYLDNVNYNKITHDTVLIEQLEETLHGVKVEGYYLQKRDIRITHSSKADTVYMPEEYYCERYILTENVGGISNVLGTITKDTIVETRIARDKKCDSIQIRTIHILPAPIKDTVDIISCGDYYDKTLDTTFTSTQNYVVSRKFNNSKCDCDSSITLLRYEIRTTKYNNISVSGCSEAEYTFYGKTKPTIFKVSTDTTEVIRYKSGPDCDSIINNIHIAVANPIYDTVMKSTCGDTIMYNGKVYKAADGDYKETITFKSKAGCDSLIRLLDFRFVETIENKLPTRYGCDSVKCDINGKTYFEDHTISEQTGETEQGCPIFTVQEVIVLHPVSTNLEVNGCEFAEFNDKLYYNDTTLILPLKSKLCDCDSTVFVDIKVLPRIESPTIYLSDCDSVMVDDPENGIVTIKEDVDDYQCVYQKVHNIAGKQYICDSIVHYNIHVKKPTYSSVTYTGESTVTYNDIVYRRSQTIRDTLINAEGCDSFVEIKIVVEKDLGYPVIVDKFGYTLFCNNNIGSVRFASYQWYKDGVAIEGATKEYYEEAKGKKLDGCYQVEVTSDNGREYASEIYCVDKDRELKVYPNPVEPNEIITIDYPFTEPEKKNLLIEIYDINGMMIKDLVPTSYPIMIEAPAMSGHYFIMILESNERMLDARFIVR